MPFVFRIGRGLLAAQVFGVVLLAPMAAFLAAVAVWIFFAEMNDLGPIGRVALALLILVSWRLVSTDGARRVVGQSNAMAMPLPFEKFAAALRERGVPTVDAPALDRGGMWRPMFGREPARAQPVSDAAVARKRRVVPMVMQASAVVATLAAILRVCAG